MLWCGVAMLKSSLSLSISGHFLQWEVRTNVRYLYLHPVLVSPPVASLHMQCFPEHGLAVM